MPYDLIDYSSCPKVIKDFIFYISTIKNLSPNTVNGYYVDLRTFFRFLKYNAAPKNYLVEEIDQIDISDIDIEFVRKITSADILEYLNFVMRTRKNNSATRARKLACLRSYFKYLNLKLNLIEDDPVKNIDVPTLKKSMPKFLSLEESRMLLDAIEPGEFYTRDYCIITLFLNCGMRLSELVGISLTDIRDDTIRIVGKGNKERFVYLNNACMDALEKWQASRIDFIKPTEKDALFLSKQGRRITARRVEQIVDNALDRAGLVGRGYSAHKLRHTAATLMYQYGDADMLSLKEILGHAHVSTTEIYTHINNEKLKETVASSPLSNLKGDPNKSEGD